MQYVVMHCAIMFTYLTLIRFTVDWDLCESFHRSIFISIFLFFSFVLFSSVLFASKGIVWNTMKKPRWQKNFNHLLYQNQTHKNIILKNCQSTKMTDEVKRETENKTRHKLQSSIIFGIFFSTHWLLSMRDLINLYTHFFYVPFQSTFSIFFSICFFAF